MTRPKLPEFPTRDRFLVPAIIGSTALVIGGSAAQIINYAFDLQIHLLDSADDGGAFGVIGGLAAVAAAAAAWLLLIRARSRSSAVLALPLLLTFLALDKTLRLHDYIPHYLVVYAPVLVGTFVCVAAIGRRVPHPLSQIVIVALALLVVSFALHLAGERLLHWLALESNEGVRQVKIALKHGFEVEGWWLVAIGVAFSAHPGRLAAPGVSRLWRLRRVGTHGRIM